MRLPSHPIATALLASSSSYPEGMAQAASRLVPPVLEASLRGSLYVTTLTIADLPALQALRERVLRSLPDVDHYRREPDETPFLQAHVAAPHLCLGVRAYPGAHSQLVAYGMLDSPRTHVAMQSTRHDSDAIGTMCETTPQLISCMVDADFRGQGLQRYLIKARIDAGMQRGATRIWAMVAPGHHVSRDNLRAAGFRYLATREIDGHTRHIMMLDSHRHEHVCAEVFASQRLMLR